MERPLQKNMAPHQTQGLLSMYGLRHSNINCIARKNNRRYQVLSNKESSGFGFFLKEKNHVSTSFDFFFFSNYIIELPNPGGISLSPYPPLTGPRKPHRLIFFSKTASKLALDLICRPRFLLQIGNFESDCKMLPISIFFKVSSPTDDVQYPF